MTNDEFRSALKSLGLRQRWLAQRLGLAVSTVNRWATGEAPVAPYVPFVLDLLRERREIAAKLLNE
jgi:transcriptional regulator with XRE-family HTH domain